MISIIVPAYNAAKFLGNALASVQSQTYSEWEMIIVDDGSRDDTFALAQAYCEKDGRIQVFTQKNAGVSVARNFGFSKARANYPFVLFLDSDDMLLPETLQKLLHQLEPHAEIPAVCGLVQEVDAAGAMMEANTYFETVLNRRGIVGHRLVRREPASGIAFGDICFHNYITTPGSVLVRKSVLDPPVVFDPTQGYTADWDLWWRITMVSGPIAVVTETVLLYRIHGANMSQNRTAARRGVFTFQQNLLTYPGMSREQRRTARMGYFYHSLVYGEYAAYYLKQGQIKKGFKQLGLAVRDLLRFSRNIMFLQSGASAFFL